MNKFHFNHSTFKAGHSPASLLEKGWTLAMYEVGALEGRTTMYTKLINSYLKKTDQEICYENTKKYMTKYTREEFEDKLREFYDLPRNITPQAVLKAKEKNHELSEHEEQCKVVKWCRENDIKVFAIPNGFISGGDAKYINYMKAEGLTPGSPDLVVLPGDGLVIFVEMKKEKGGRLSEAQKNFQQFFDNNSYLYICAKGHQNAIASILEIMEDI